MPEHLNGNTDALKQLAAPARNNYFYGKLLDVFHFQMEQNYFNRKRWLLNRLGLGAGVLCGLEVVPTEDGQKVWVRPGVAVDPLGREIIVPAAYCLENPRQPTDGHGRPAGDPITGEGAVTLCLAFHECETEPAPVLVGDCDTRQDCAPGTIRERYRLLVRTGLPAAVPGQISAEQCQAIFPAEEMDEEFSHRNAACETLAGPCAAPEETCVILATLALPADQTAPLTVDACTYRTPIYSNTLLWELITCLAGRVDACCQVRSLRYVSGDGQQAEPGATLAEPLVVEVVNGEGDPVADEEVTFRVRSGGGMVSPDRVLTDSNGQAQTNWQLGPGPGLHSLEASISSGSQIVFYALAGAGDGGGPTLPPVVTAIWPPNAGRLDRNERWLEVWREQPRLAVTFDREMNQDQLQDPELVDQWLRLWRIEDHGEIVVRRVAIKILEITDSFLDQAGFTAVYLVDQAEPLQPARYLVQMRAAGGNITDTGSPPLLLDAEFAGSDLRPAQLNRIWNIEDEAVFGERDIWEALVDSGASLPQSGDGAEGGRFHSWFELFIEQ